MPGVESAEVDFETKTATLKVGPDVDIAVLQEAVKAGGYTATPKN